MPDHVHLVWIGISETSDQRTASSFFRGTFGPSIAPARWQHQPHDHVLRDTDRERNAFAATCSYISENPVRKGLVEHADQWPLTGCVIPGYPHMNPFVKGHCDLFWRINAACADRSRLGKM